LTNSFLTVINLLESNLCIVRQALLRFARQHEGLRLLRRRHRGTVLRVHFRDLEAPKVRGRVKSPACERNSSVIAAASSQPRWESDGMNVRSRGSGRESVTRLCKVRGIGKIKAKRVAFYRLVKMFV
jgi:hypothetical protein